MTDGDLTGFSWSVELPDRGCPSFGGPFARAGLSLSSPDGDETWSVPVAVGRRLEDALAEGLSFAASRAELAYQVKRLSLACGSSRVERLINKRDYSSRELHDKLRRDGYSTDVCDELVGRAKESRLVDDGRYAAVFIRSKVYAGWGRMKIERELSRKGISVEDVQGWPEEFFSEDDERERANELASRRRLTGKNDFQKIVRFLCGKGYSMNIAIDAAKSALGR